MRIVPGQLAFFGNQLFQQTALAVVEITDPVNVVCWDHVICMSCSTDHVITMKSESDHKITRQLN